MVVPMPTCAASRGVLFARIKTSLDRFIFGDRSPHVPYKAHFCSVFCALLVRYLGDVFEVSLLVAFVVVHSGVGDLQGLFSFGGHQEHGLVFKLFELFIIVLLVFVLQNTVKGWYVRRFHLPPSQLLEINASKELVLLHSINFQSDFRVICQK